MKAECCDSAEHAEEIVWERITDEAAWSRRDSMGEVVYDGKMWLLGGYTPERVNDVWVSSDGVNWQQAIAAAPWRERNLPCSLVYDNKMWIMAGFGRGLNSSYNDVWHSSDGRNWTQAADNAPWSARGAATAVVYNDKMWIMGGFDVGDFTHNNEVWHSSDGKHWEQAADNAPWSARAMHTSVVFDDKMWVIGGGIYNTRYPQNTVMDHNDVWCSDDGKNWCEVTGAAEWPARRFHRSVVYDDRIWVIAGYHYGNRNDVWVSSDGKNWQETKTPAKWPIRHAPSCLVYDNRLWVIGGFGEVLYNDVWAYAKVRQSHTVEIRRFEVADVESLRPLVDQFVVAHRRLSFRADYWSPLRRWLVSQAEDTNAVVLVACDGTRPVGMMTATIQENGPLLAPERVGYIGLVVVAADHRRQGIGQRLWDTTRDWLLSKGIEEVELYTEVGNTTSDGFWDRQGFAAFLQRRRKRIRGEGE